VLEIAATNQQREQLFELEMSSLPCLRKRLNITSGRVLFLGANETRPFMRMLITGSSGHLGEALVRTLQGSGHEVVGLDVTASHFTSNVGSITDRGFVRQCVQGVDSVLHTATLHKPHVSTHTRQEFVDTNITGTLNLLEEATSSGVGSFIFTSTTSAFGGALTPPGGAPATWVTEDVRSIPRNIYGVTKTAAEDLCELFHRQHRLACLILRTSRFFPEEDDSPKVRRAYDDSNVKVNEFLYRRVIYWPSRRHL
jgi:UDP-glucose 4-epimerase